MPKNRFENISISRRTVLGGLAGLNVIPTVGAVGTDHPRYSQRPLEPGREIWRYETGSAVASSPTIYNGTLYVGSNDGNVYALDAATGEQEWSFETNRRVVSSPTVRDGTIYVGSADENLYAIDAATGSQVWEFSCGAAVYSSPTVTNEHVFINPNERRLYSVNRTTGSQAWSLELYDSTPSSPVISDGIVFIGDDIISAISISEEDRRWWYRGISDRELQYGNYSTISSPTVVENTVFIGAGGDDEGYVYAVNSDNGRKDWIHTDISRVDTSPTVANETVYVGGITGFGYDTIQALNSEDGEVIWTRDTDGDVRSSPTVAGDAVYFGCEDGRIYALNRSTGTQLWTFDTGAPVFSSPTVVNGAVYVGTDNGFIYAISTGHSASSRGSRTRDQTLGHYSGDTTIEFVPVPVITVNTADIVSGSEYNFEVGQEIAFNASESGHPDGRIVSYEWDFNSDGNFTTNGISVTHAYETPGEYTVTLRVRDSDGRVATDTQQLNVIVVPSVESFRVEPAVPEPGTEFTVDASVLENDTSIEHYQWDFNDDGFFESNGETVTHTYESTGEYPITLKVTNEYSASATVTRTVSVTDRPTSAFTISQSNPLENTEVQLNATRSSDTDSEIVEYEWDVDNDGSFEYNGSILNHEFNTTGEYPVTLRVTDENGSSATATRTVVVRSESTSMATSFPEGTTGRSTELVSEENSGVSSDRGEEEADSIPMSVIAIGGAGLLFGGSSAAIWQLRRNDDTESSKSPDDKDSEAGNGTEGDNETTAQGEREDSQFDDPDPIEIHQPIQELTSFVATDCDVTTPLFDQYSGHTDRTSAHLTVLNPGEELTSEAVAETFIEIVEKWIEVAHVEGVQDVLEWGVDPCPWVLVEDLDQRVTDGDSGRSRLESASVLADVADTLRTVERYNVRHLGLTPDHIGVTSADADSQPVVGDWGLRWRCRNRAGIAHDSPYVAPEQIAPSEYGEVGQHTDVYRLGAVAYEFVTGRPPYDPGASDLQKRILEGEVVSPTAVNEDLSPAVDNLLETALAVDPNDRTLSIAQFRERFVVGFDTQID